MHYIWTFIWTFLLVHMVTYVVSSMLAETYDFATGSILGVAVTILICIIGFILPNEPNAHQH